MWIKNNLGFYIHEIRGACFITWVNEIDRAHAFIFPVDKIDEWLETMQQMSGENLLIPIVPY